MSVADCLMSVDSVNWLGSEFTLEPHFVFGGSVETKEQLLTDIVAQQPIKAEPPTCSPPTPTKLTLAEATR